ncbi:MAG: phosphonoacetaldehyde reductase [Clostridia bacterium]|nr:phosphonoacetaldehyde reductase [Clostridia bacterium]
MIIGGKNAIKNLNDVLNNLNAKKLLLVCDSSFDFLNIKEDILSLNVPMITFSDFTPNPLYEDVKKGVELFRSENCDVILAVGGGSSIDVAKCIKLFSKMNDSDIYLNQEFKDTKVPLIAIPTTAGTGSESTRYAVIYYKGQKQSVTHQSIIPDVALLHFEVLKTLPLYQKKCTLLDALCQGVESWWSVNSTDESKKISEKAVKAIIKYTKPYLEGDKDAAEQIMLASNLAGQAINITQTTAAHAMSYKLTSLYKIPHGHAAAVCLPEVWQYMIENSGLCIDPRGKAYLESIFAEIACALGFESPADAVKGIKAFLKELEIFLPAANNRTEELELLAKSVNPVRLGNNPVKLTEDVLYSLYERIVN